MAKKNSKSLKGKCVSMTGFASVRKSLSQFELVCEVRAVNSRFFEFSAKLPVAFSALEGAVRERARQLFERGRVELALVVRQSAAVGIDQDRFDQVVKQYAWALKRISQQKFYVGESAQAEIAKLALEKSRTVPGYDDALLQIEEKVIWKLIEQAFEQLKKEREREGASLFKDLQQRVERLSQIYHDAQTILADLPSRTRQQVERRVKELAAGIKLDENRLAQEIVHICDRADVTEELVRINGHLVATTQALQQSVLGRRLDFLVQELLREFNTLGNKAQNLAVQSLVVEAKLELEKVREQAQNLV